jgi:phage gpG-like protein
MNNTNPAKETLKKLKKAKRTIVTNVGNSSLKFFKNSFKKGGFTSNSFNPWKKPKRMSTQALVDLRTASKQLGKSIGMLKRRGIEANHLSAEHHAMKGKLASAKRAYTRAILVKSGALRNSVRKIGTGDGFTVSSDLEYAAVHNFGLMAGRGKGFRMPKRTFVAPSRTLNKNVDEYIKFEIEKIL